MVQDIAKKNLNSLSACSTAIASLKLVGCEFNVSSFFVFFRETYSAFISTFSVLWKNFELFLILCRIKKKDMNYLQHDIFFSTDHLNCSLVRRIIGKPATGVNNRIFCSIYTKRCFVKQSVEKYFSANCADFSLDGQNSLQVEADESLLGEPRFDCSCKHIIDPKIYHHSF